MPEESVILGMPPKPRLATYRDRTFYIAAQSLWTYYQNISDKSLGLFKYFFYAHVFHQAYGSTNLSWVTGRVYCLWVGLSVIGGNIGSLTMCEMTGIAIPPPHQKKRNGAFHSSCFTEFSRLLKEPH